MSSLDLLMSRELVFLILQFLDEEKYKDTVHMLEKESGLFFNMRYFEDAVTNGKWDDVEKYLSGFTKVEDNTYSQKIFFQIRKQKYLEALFKQDRAKALEILRKDLKVFSTYSQDIFQEIKQLTLLLTLGNIRDNEKISKYGDTQSARALMLDELKQLIEANPVFHDKLQFPSLKNSGLKMLIKQSITWQHQHCGQPIGAQAPSFAPRQVVSAGPIGITPSNAVMLKRPRIPPPTNLAMDYQTAHSKHVLKRSQPLGLFDKSNDLPKKVVVNLNQGSAVKSMDFHPRKDTLLLVGTSIGDISAWDVGIRERLALRNFKVWELGRCTKALQEALANEYTASVNRVAWSHDGALFGVAFSKHIVHIYSYQGGDDIQNHLEIDAHVGYVSDIAFSRPNKELCFIRIITCGEDKYIRVWDAVTGSKQYTFEGHEAPVYSVCPHTKENIQFIYSTGIDGKIKVWLYDNAGSKFDYDAPGHCCTRMAYSADGTRLFSCGTTKEGETYIVEWKKSYESKGAVNFKRYHGRGKRSFGVVQFDMTQNRFLAAGDDFRIKFWDMDNLSLLTTTDAEGGLQASPCIRFSNSGSLLAVSTNENSVKILASSIGERLVLPVGSRAHDASSIASGTTAKNQDYGSLSDVKPKSTDETSKSMIWERTEITNRSQLCSLRLPDIPTSVIRLTYTNSGDAILALAYNAIHKLWRWQRNERNSTGKVTTSVPPQLWQPSSGILMTNDICETNLEDVVPCFALSKNDSYVMSASGAKVSLFNMKTFMTMTTFMPPPPAATYLAFHPQDNNIIAVGMEDSSIQIYNVRTDEVIIKLKGHQKRITGLSFSNFLDVLVSSGADAQLCVWKTDQWEKLNSKFLQIPSRHKPTSLSQTRVQFHQDQVHLLVVHETQIAIHEARKLECVQQWVPLESCVSVTDATYSCDSQTIYASFDDGSVSVFTAATLSLRCRISLLAYLPIDLSFRIYPLAVAAHPSDPHQIALGLTDGGVHVLEPLQAEGRWGTTPSVENSAASSEQASR